MKRKLRRIWYVPLLCLAMLAAFLPVHMQETKAAETGYTDHAHTWSVAEDCGGCKAKAGYTDCTKCGHTGKVSCSTCGGTGSVTCTVCSGRGFIVAYNGYTSVYGGTYYISVKPCTGCETRGSGISYYYYASQSTAQAAQSSQTVPSGYVGTSSGCISSSGTQKCSSGCSGTGKVSCSTCSGKGYLSSCCTRCNGTGTNYYCTNSGCTLRNTDYKSTYKYNNWASELSGNKNGSNWLTETAYKVCYKTADTYKVTLDNQSATTAGTTAYYQLYDSGIYTTSACSAKITSITKPTRTGYTFSGYYTGKNGTGTCYINASGTILSGASTFSANTTLYAFWEENTYTITLANQSATGAGTTAYYQLYNKGIYTTSACSTTIASITAPTKTGYDFGGYYTGTNGSGTCYINSSGSIIAGSTTFTANTTLYAYWIPQKFTITLNNQSADSGQGGTAAYYVKYGSGNYTSTAYTTTISSITKPTRIGYTFSGYYTGANGTGTCYINANGTITSTGTTFLENTTLYAYWQKNEYEIEFCANSGQFASGGEYTYAYYYYQDTVDLSLLASKEGYIFVGWALEPDATEVLESLPMPAEDITLYAIYSIQVSDVANHTYPDYEQVKEEEVYLILWEKGNPSNAKTYPLSYVSDSGIMTYRYRLDRTDASAFVGSLVSYEYAVIAYDNAGNSSKLCGASGYPEADRYLQTVEYYRYDAVSDDWIWFDTYTESVLEGEAFTPYDFALTVDGYSLSAIEVDGSRVENLQTSYSVTEERVSRIYYVPDAFRLSFDANGGTVSPASKSITYNDYYGELPTPVRAGYVFLQWNTKADGTGEKITGTDRYRTADDSTIFAQWEINSFNVIYDYWTNGGLGVSEESKAFVYGTAIDLTVTAVKEGWEFVGWALEPNATEVLELLPMPAEDIRLYAIYRKVLTVSCVDRSDDGIVIRTESVVIFNRETEGSIVVQSQNEWNGWQSLGWSYDTEANASIKVSSGSTIMFSDDIILYGRYQKEVTLSYDVNGVAVVLNEQNAYRQYNAADNYENPVLTVNKALELDNHSFVAWEDKEAGVSYNPGDSIELLTDVTLTAEWDRYPEIYAYDRYFTLKQAQEGMITEEALLSKVTASDAEDGVLANGSAVVVLAYDAGMFTPQNGSFTKEITYQAKDSFGNITQKTITVHVVDTTVKESGTKTYYRFISSRFYKEGGDYVQAAEGGLEETSVWKTNPAYQSLLEAVMSNKKINQVTKKISFYGNETDYVIPGSGEWEHVEETWYFTKEDIAKSNEFREQYGFGSSKGTDYLEKFLEWFGHCRK